MSSCSDRKWRRIMPLRFRTYLHSASTWKCDTLWVVWHVQIFLYFIFCFCVFPGFICCASCRPRCPSCLLIWKAPPSPMCLVQTPPAWSTSSSAGRYEDPAGLTSRPLVSHVLNLRKTIFDTWGGGGMSNVISISSFRSELCSQPMSWCKVEAIALKSDQISVVKDLPPPPLIIMSISLKTVPNPKTHHNEVRQIVLEGANAPPSPLLSSVNWTVVVVDFDLFLFCFVLYRSCLWLLLFITSFLWTRRLHASLIRPISVVSDAF